MVAVDNPAYRPWFATTLNKIEDYTPCISIGSKGIVLYDRYSGGRSRSLLPRSNKSNGIISSKQGRRIGYYVNLLADTARTKRVFNSSTKKWYSFKLNFITLTLPSSQIHTDKEIHQRVFKSFIRAWKSIAPELLYIYKAEVQDNGNLHYHLSTNTYIDKMELRHMWNRWVDTLGYVERSSIDSPNSTDVHKTKDIQNLAAYMVSYLSKKDMYNKKLKRYHKIYGKYHKSNTGDVCVLPKNYFKNIKRKVGIKVWDCSKTLMIKKCSIEVDNKELLDEIERAMVLAKDVHKGDWYLYIKQDKDVRKELKVISRLYHDHIKQIRDHTRSKPPSEYQ